MNQLLDTQAPGAGRHPASPSFMEGREGLPVRLRENADQIDDRIRSPDGCLDSLVIENVGLDLLDPCQP